MNTKLDLILKNCMESFLKDFNISDNEESLQFEHFANYCIFSRYCPSIYCDNHLFYEICHTGQGGDWGIDGIMILINNHPVTNIEEFNGIVGNAPFKVKFIFVQTKMSSSFDSGAMMKTGFGVKDLLSNNSERKSNPKLLNYKRLIETIYSKSNRFESIPECQIYFVTTGKWCEDEELMHIKKYIESDIQQLNVTESVEFTPIDLNKIRNFYRDATQAISKTIKISKVVSLPKIDGVTSAYIGIVNLKEIYRMITDEDGVLLSSIFYDNVRDFQGYNAVNSEIKSTLLTADKSVRFPLLNNGITVVAKKIIPSGDDYNIFDFQVVNGCQTCNVIYDCGVLDDIYCTIKLISSEDSETINDIIRATNRQTEVKDEAFESLKEIHKNIQNYFSSIEDSNSRLYYERRSREFSNNGNINRSRIVSLTSLICGYLSMFLDEPHSTHRYYGELLKSYQSTIFNAENKLILYYTEAWCLYKIEQMLFSDKRYNRLKKYRYHFLMLFAHLAAKKPNPFRPNSKEVEKYCQNIIEKINDENSFKQLMSQSCSILSEAIEALSHLETNGNELLRIKEFSRAICKAADKNLM